MTNDPIIPEVWAAQALNTLRQAPRMVAADPNTPPQRQPEERVMTAAMLIAELSQLDPQTPITACDCAYCEGSTEAAKLTTCADGTAHIEGAWT